ncbi:MAG: HAMP domain-containing protein [Alphaproteobacteria bacterium]|nr:HAMP domain-containing protein [Alphaproteobacteria bacterium]
MTIRLKILAISAAMLAILSVALLGSVLIQDEVHEEIAAIVEYHVPLNAAISEFDVATSEYELNLSRLLREDPITSEHLQHTERREREIIVLINGSVERAVTLISRGIDDRRNDVADRLVLARILGTFNLVRRDVPEFEALGLEVIQAIRAGDIGRARGLMRGFARFTRSFGPDLADIRRDVARLTEHSVTETLERQRHVELIGIAVFVVAAVFGLGVAGALAHRMVGSLRELVAGARAVEKGTLFEPLPVQSRDEIGQLTQSFNHMVGELRAKERITATFGKYVDPKIVARLIDTTDASAELAERRLVTVYFSDIKGFSSLSEQLTAGVIANLLNRYFGLASETIRAHHGVIDKYIGDSVMAFWTQPFSAGDQHAADACLAALAVENALDALRADLPNILGLRRQLPELVVRMGLATGEVVVGTIGAPASRTFTVIGDTVNLASRLEGINKVYGTRIIVSEDTFRLAQAAIEARELDTIAVAGKNEPVRIYQVLGTAGSVDGARAELRRIYGEGLTAYRVRQWDVAQAAFEAALAIDAGDGPARVMLERAAKLRAAAPSDDWDGVWRMTEK